MIGDVRPLSAKMFADPGNGLCRNIKDNVWYINQAMGKNTLSKFVKTICDKAGVEGWKTNHSARKTTVSSLMHAGVPPTQVMQISGHKNVQSINNYSSASIEQQKQMSKIRSDVTTGNDDTPVNVENSSVGNFNISDGCDDFKLGNALEEIENVKYYKTIQCPDFVTVITKESLCSYFKERQLQTT